MLSPLYRFGSGNQPVFKARLKECRAFLTNGGPRENADDMNSYTRRLSNEIPEEIILPL